jgi:hypothetical protein
VLILIRNEDQGLKKKIIVYNLYLELCVYVYICIYIYMSIYIYMYTYIYIYVHIQANIDPKSGSRSGKTKISKEERKNAQAYKAMMNDLNRDVNKEIEVCIQRLLIGYIYICIYKHLCMYVCMYKYGCMHICIRI